MNSLLACAVFLVFASIEAVHGVLFSSLPRSLDVSVAMNEAGEFKSVVEAGEDQLHVKWSANQSASAQTSSYKVIKVQLCYAPPSQKDRGWRKTKDDLHKDKTCQFTIVKQPFSGVAGNSTVWRIKKDTPGALYFVRAYAYNSTDQAVAYGQTTNTLKTSNIFTVVPISGRPKSLYIATVVFSVFSIASLFALFIFEKRSAAIKKGK